MAPVQNLSVEDSYGTIIDLLQRSKPFTVSRIGLGGESLVAAYAYTGTPAAAIAPQIRTWFHVNAGFYGSEDYAKFAGMYIDACRSSDAHVYMNFELFNMVEQFIVPPREGLPRLDHLVLEPFRRFDITWIDRLSDKKVLVVHPFAQTMRRQYLGGSPVWGEHTEKMYSPDYIFYKSVQSIGGKGPHKNWYESFDRMLDDISNIDFDVALLGCGAYGMPLVGSIKKDLGKSAVYVGGGLQLYFGIYGNRWQKDSTVLEYMSQQHWTRPAQDEMPEHAHLVEGGCYW